jgi:hypothetical protein
MHAASKTCTPVSGLGMATDRHISGLLKELRTWTDLGLRIEDLGEGRLSRVVLTLALSRVRCVEGYRRRCG